MARFFHLSDSANWGPLRVLSIHDIPASGTTLCHLRELSKHSHLHRQYMATRCDFTEVLFSLQLSSVIRPVYGHPVTVRMNNTSTVLIFSFHERKESQQGPIMQEFSGYGSLSVFQSKRQKNVLASPHHIR